MKRHMIIIALLLITACSPKVKDTMHESLKPSGIKQSLVGEFSYCNLCPGPTVKYLDIDEIDSTSKNGITSSVSVHSETKNNVDSIKDILRTIYFDLDSYQISKKDASFLSNVKIDQDLTIEVSGYTDGYGSKPYNSTLANRRAIAVVKLLKLQNPKNIIHIKANGKCCYVNNSPFNSMNRRVEIAVK